MSVSRINLLLIEDNPLDARLVEETLSETPYNIEAEWADTLSIGLERLYSGGVDVVLLDLGLPESVGLDTFRTVYEQMPDIPILVFTNRDDEETAIEALKSGAQDYLVKGQVDGNLLARSLRYAIERHRLLAELEMSRQKENKIREARALDQISHAAAASKAPGSAATVLLNADEKAPFEALVNSYGELLDAALRARMLKSENDVSTKLRALAIELGKLGAGPRDAVEVHRTALEEKSQNATPQEVRAYSEEGRFLVLELMGHLVSYYRSAFLRAAERDRPVTPVA